MTCNKIVFVRFCVNQDDIFENDIRRMTLRNNNYNIIKITSTIILDSNYDKKEYIEIQYNKYLLKFSVNF
jgi:hypothetical protein